MPKKKFRSKPLLAPEHPVIPAYFAYVDQALTESLASIDPLFVKLPKERSHSVLWRRKLETGFMPYRFINLHAYRGREEFGIDIGWSDGPEFPQACYFSHLVQNDRHIDDRSPPVVRGNVPLVSELILGSMRDIFTMPSFEALPPTRRRLADGVRQCFASREGQQRLRSFMETCGIKDQFESARTAAGARRVVPVLFTQIFGKQLSTDWQLIRHLSALRPPDDEVALVDPCTVASVLLMRHAIPFLQSTGLTPLVEER